MCPTILFGPGGHREFSPHLGGPSTYRCVHHLFWGNTPLTIRVYERVHTFFPGEISRAHTQEDQFWRGPLLGEFRCPGDKYPALMIRERFLMSRIESPLCGRGPRGEPFLTWQRAPKRGLRHNLYEELPRVPIN